MEAATTACSKYGGVSRPIVIARKMRVEICDGGDFRRGLQYNPNLVVRSLVIS